jgi:hypothetical protein
MNDLQKFIKIIFQYIKRAFAGMSKEEQEGIVDEIEQHLVLIKNTVKKKETNQEALLRIAKENLGSDITPNDRVKDEVACAESLSALIRKLDPEMPIIPGTWTLLDYLKKSPKFERVWEVENGNIIINATGTGNGLIRGHCGVIMRDNRIASNNSHNGLWEDYFTLNSWNTRTSFA